MALMMKGRESPSFPYAYLLQTIPHFLLNIPRFVLSSDEELRTRRALDSLLCACSVVAVIQRDARDAQTVTGSRDGGCDTVLCMGDWNPNLTKSCLFLWSVTDVTPQGSCDGCVTTVTGGNCSTEVDTLTFSEDEGPFKTLVFTE